MAGAYCDEMQGLYCWGRVPTSPVPLPPCPSWPTCLLHVCDRMHACAGHSWMLMACWMLRKQVQAARAERKTRGCVVLTCLDVWCGARTTLDRGAPYSS